MVLRLLHLWLKRRLKQMRLPSFINPVLNDSGRWNQMNLSKKQIRSVLVHFIRPKSPGKPQKIPADYQLPNTVSNSALPIEINLGKSSIVERMNRPSLIIFHLVRELSSAFRFVLVFLELKHLEDILGNLSRRSFSLVASGIGYDKTR